MRARPGIALAETLTAGAIAAIVIGFAGAVFVSARTMLRDTVRETELAMAGALLREKLLHALAPPESGVFTGGLLAATNSGSIVEGGATPNVLARCFAFDAASGRESAARDVRLLLDGDGGARYLLNERASAREAAARYLRPGGVRLDAESIAQIVEAEDGGEGGQLVLRCPLALGPARRDETVRATLFGRRQSPPEVLR